MRSLLGLAILFVGTSAFARPMPSLNPAPPADSRAGFLKLMRSPTILILREFRKVCSTSGTNIDFDQDQEVFDKLKELQKRPDSVKLRGLVFAAQKCTQGKSNESLVEFLGVDILLSQPRLLVRALTQENAGSPILVSIAKAEPDEIAGVECTTPECATKRREAYKKKVTALESLEIKKNERPVRETLLTAIRPLSEAQ